MSLLDMAKAVELKRLRRSPRSDIAQTREEFDLAMAFLAGDVTHAQVSKVIGKSGIANTMNWLRRALWNGVRCGVADVVRRQP